MKARIFIDGAVGTTGLQIKSRLDKRDDLELVHLPDHLRKDDQARSDMLNSVDVAILCLPDAAAVDAAQMITSSSVKIIDASSAHRVAENWAYGFAELNVGQRDIIFNATRVSNPGCYALASVAMLNPLLSKGIIERNHPVTINAISGYSGGGKPLIADFENGSDVDTPFFVYGLNLHHKHVPEIQTHSGLKHRPVFVPSVGHFAQGMIVQLPIPLWSLTSGAKVQDIHGALKDHYADQQFVTVVDLQKTESMPRLEPEWVNNTNELRLHVFNADDQVVVMALLDNLGKGASGSCVQNLNIMLGLNEGTGL